jgi:hypothetical protein
MKNNIEMFRNSTIGVARKSMINKNSIILDGGLGQELQKFDNA